MLIFLVLILISTHKWQSNIFPFYQDSDKMHPKRCRKRKMHASNSAKFLKRGKRKVFVKLSNQIQVPGENKGSIGNSDPAWKYCRTKETSLGENWSIKQNAQLNILKLRTTHKPRKCRSVLPASISGPFEKWNSRKTRVFCIPSSHLIMEMLVLWNNCI